MQSYDARYASFTPSHRSKSSSKGPTNLKWPHPTSFLATPSTLASAGFYFNPSATTPDAVSCFICNKGLADWDPGDDPAEIHIQKCPKCPWAMLKCVTETSDNGSFKFSSSRFPSSRTMEKARLATFGPEGTWWPHNTKTKGPSSKMMAKAGFIFAPANNRDDTCMCIYCGIELAGWEPEDDPMEEHRSRQAKKGPCSFFTNSGSVSESTKRARSRSKPLPTTPIASSSDQEYHPPGTRSSTRPPSTKQPPSSNKSKKSAKSSKKASKVKKTMEDEVIAEYRVALDEDDDAPPKPPPKPRRANSRSRSRASTRGTTTDDIDVDVPSLSSAPMLKLQPQAKPISTVSSASVSAMQPVPKSFQSPEDQEFAREEQALEEQARQLMLVNSTLSLVSRQPLGENAFVAKSHHEVMEDVAPGNSSKVPLLDKGKGKVKAPTATHSTPSRTSPIAKATLPTLAKFPQLLPEDCVIALTETERAMTVEQWVRHEMDRQYERLKTDGRQKIDAFKARAIEVAKQIELL